ncbi:unnamed protein product [Protopolystoma xenopodis]|uniref:Uncharacterized protein n=1 Tax=Protopolystoma xenopodis TaxID=117903 RepID=A0A3S5B5W0_9PLAT|nr:unnamed protein product [Protopolystoma xenopodis]
MGQRQLLRMTSEQGQAMIQPRVRTGGQNSGSSSATSEPVVQRSRISPSGAVVQSSVFSSSGLNPSTGDLKRRPDSNLVRVPAARVSSSDSQHRSEGEASPSTSSASAASLHSEEAMSLHAGDVVGPTKQAALRRQQPACHSFSTQNARKTIVPRKSVCGRRAEL